MAFIVKKGKKSKRIANPNQEDYTDPEAGTTDGDSSDDSSEETEDTGHEGEIDFVPPGFPIPPKFLGSNVVATQSWVYRMMKGFWNWTRFFATQTLQVASEMYSKRIKTEELQGGDVYAKRLVLLDPKGKPAVVYIDENGDLQREYKFEDVFLYGGDGVDIKSYFYRIPGNIMANFVGLTPIETLMNFTPFQKIDDSVEFNGKTCPRLCEADGIDELVKETLLLKCPQTKKIVGLKVVDSDGELVKELDFEPP